MQYDRPLKNWNSLRIRQRGGKKKEFETNYEVCRIIQKHKIAASDICIASCWSQRPMAGFFYALCLFTLFCQKPVLLYIICLYVPKLPTYQAILHSRMRCPLPSLRDQTMFSHERKQEQLHATYTQTILILLQQRRKASRGG